MTGPDPAGEPGSRQSKKRRARLGAMRDRGARAARPACLSCMIMALFWALGTVVELPGWALPATALAGLVLVGAFVVARRGRTVRW